MIYYIDILSYMYPHFQLNSWTIHRFLLVATMISQKAMEDYFIPMIIMQKLVGYL